MFSHVSVTSPLRLSYDYLRHVFRSPLRLLRTNPRACPLVPSEGPPHRRLDEISYLFKMSKFLLLGKVSLPCRTYVVFGTVLYYFFPLISVKSTFRHILHSSHSPFTNYNCQKIRCYNRFFFTQKFLVRPL